MTMEYILKDGKVIGIKLDFGVNLMEDEDKGILIEFAKRKFASNILKQISDGKRSVISFGLYPEEAHILEAGLKDIRERKDGRKAIKEDKA